MPPSTTTPEEYAGLQQRLLNLYTPLEEAVAELRSPRRRSLRKELSHLLPPSPRFDQEEGVAVQNRHVATPNLEIRCIRELAASVNLDLFFFEYHADKLVFCNPCKKALGWMRFHKSDKGVGTTCINVINFSQQGRPIRDIRTLWGQPLVDFHHELMQAEWPELSPDAFWDASDWYHQRGNPKSYYTDFFSLFIAHSILFEVFLLDDVELPFTRDIVLPAFEEVWTRYGLKPLVVRMVPAESETDYRYWLSYSPTVKKYTEERLRACSPFQRSQPI